MSLRGVRLSRIKLGSEVQMSGFLSPKTLFSLLVLLHNVLVGFYIGFVGFYVSFVVNNWF